MSETSSTRTPAATRTSMVVTGSFNPISAETRDPFIDPCPPWCQDVLTGHRFEAHDIDRVHSSETQCIEHRYGISDVDFGGNRRETVVHPACIRTYVIRRSIEREPRIEVGVNDNAGFELTPAEAVALSDVLRELAKQAEQ